MLSYLRFTTSQKPPGFLSRGRWWDRGHGLRVQEWKKGLPLCLMVPPATDKLYSGLWAPPLVSWTFQCLGPIFVDFQPHPAAYGLPQGPPVYSWVHSRLHPPSTYKPYPHHPSILEYTRKLFLMFCSPINSFVLSLTFRKSLWSIRTSYQDFSSGQVFRKNKSLPEISPRSLRGPSGQIRKLMLGNGTSEE